VLTDPQITRLLATCSGSGYRDRRDLAILRLLLEGPRLAEVTGLAVEDVDLGDRQVWVLGKGRRQRPVPIGAKTAKALDRWIRTRDAQTHWDPWRDRPGALWVGSTGHPMTGSGVSQVVRRRGRQIGIEGLHPHQFRHTFSHLWLAGGGEGSDLMKINGWSSRSMLDRYGSSVATERAQKAHRRLAPGDRF
jgi:integrase